MTEHAENLSLTGENEPAPAAGSELSIPKHRFDEVNAKLRRLEEEVQIKDRLYLEDRQRASATQNRVVEPEMTAEEFGLDPQMFQAVSKVSARMADKMVRQKEQLFNQQIGILAERTEKAELLASRGADKAKYLPDIQRKQQEHFQRTGSFIPADTVLELLLSDEKDAHIRRLEARLAGQAQGASPSSAEAGNRGTQALSGPGTSGTRQMPSAGVSTQASGGAKSYSEMSLEEMEARLEEGFRSGTAL